jgi:LysM repeat protein
MVINLWTKSSASSLINNKPELATLQSESEATVNRESPVQGFEKQILGVSTADEPKEAQKQFTSYVVQSGDTLFNISQQYNIQWDLIAEINNLNEPYLLHAGQALKIPQATTSQVPNKIYTIQSGDTLFSIARTYNITVNDIIAVNPNLQQSDLITVGQVIKLP